MRLRPERFLPSSDEVAREASTEATGELVTRAHSDTALAQLKSRPASRSRPWSSRRCGSWAESGNGGNGGSPLGEFGARIGRHEADPSVWILACEACPASLPSRRRPPAWERGVAIITTPGSDPPVNAGSNRVTEEPLSDVTRGCPTVAQSASRLPRRHALSRKDQCHLPFRGCLKAMNWDTGARVGAVARLRCRCRRRFRRTGLTMLRPSTRRPA